MRFSRSKALFGALLIVGALAWDVSAQGPYDAQIQVALRAFLNLAHAWTKTQTFNNIVVNGTCTGCNSSSAPTTATYWLSAANGLLPNGVDLSGFSGLINNVAGTPVAYTGATCTNQVLRVLSASGSGTCVTITSSYVSNTIALTGTDINTSSQVTATHLAAALPAAQGGTGVVNTGTITLGGNLTTSGAFTTTFTVTGNTSVTLPTSGTLVNSTVATLSSLTSVGTIGTGTWHGTAVAFGFGGTGLTTAADDTVMVSSGSAWVAAAVPNCTDTGGNHLNYTAASNAFSCGTSSSGGSGSAKFEAEVYNSASQTISNTTETSASFDTAITNNDSFWAGGSPTKLTIGTTGDYCFYYNPGWQASLLGSRYVYFRMNGATQLGPVYRQVDQSNAIDGWGGEVQFCGSFTAADYVEVRVWQNTGGNTTLAGGGNNGHFAAFRLK